MVELWVDIVNNTHTETMDGVENGESDMPYTDTRKNPMPNPEYHATEVINYTHLKLYLVITFYSHSCLRKSACFFCNIIRFDLTYNYYHHISFLRFDSENMRLIPWNCQGFVDKKPRDHLKNLISRYNPDVIFICEAKIGEAKMLN